MYNAILFYFCITSKTDRFGIRFGNLNYTLFILEENSRKRDNIFKK